MGCARPETVVYVEAFKLLDGGLRDGGWAGEGRPRGGHALAILPRLNHYNVAESPLVAATILDFRGRHLSVAARLASMTKEEAMAQERMPLSERSLVKDELETTSWEMARERLANPENPRTCWLATTRPDGRPHLMPVNAFWIDGALHIVAGEGTRKARDLVADGRCVVGMSSTTLPSIDIVVEGRADPLTDVDAVRDVAQVLIAGGWPLEAKGDKVEGPNAPTAGPAPYTIFRIVPSRVFGLPGMFGMDEFDPDELPKPTRWDFVSS